MRPKRQPPNSPDINPLHYFVRNKIEHCLKTRSVIDDRAQELGLDYDDWLILKMKASEVNSYKHPTPILTKEEAYAKIESLKGTQYTNCYEPMKNLVNLFEKKQWN